MNEKIVTIIDHIGRLVVGVYVSETKTELVLNNPVILHIQPNPQSGQIGVQQFPYIFMELIKNKDMASNNWKFAKQNIVTTELELESQIIDKYKVINSPMEKTTEEPEVIKLFND